jgi:hypothetical protein
MPEEAQRAFRMRDSLQHIEKGMAIMLPRVPNGEAQPPAEAYGAVKRYGGKHESDSQKRHDSAGRLERNVRRASSKYL